MFGRATWLGWLAIACLMVLVQTAAGQSPLPASASDAAPPPSHVVFVPYDRMTGPEWGAGQSVLMPYAKFLELQESAGPDGPRPIKPVASLAQMDFTGRSFDRVVVFEGSLMLRVLAGADDTLSVALPFDGASLESLAIEGGDALAAPGDASGVLLRLRGPGDRTIKMRLAVPVATDGATRRLDVGVPRAAAASLRIALGESADIVELPGEAPAAVETIDGAATLVAAAGGRDRVRVAWRPRADATGSAVEARVAAATSSVATVSMNRVDLRSTTTLTVLAGEVGSAAFDVPAGLRILSVTGPYVREWSGPDANGRLLVNLVRAATGDVVLMVEAQSDIAEGARLTVPALRVADAVRESGSVTIVPDGSLDLWPETTTGLQAAPVDPAASGRAGARTWRYGAPGWELTLSRQALRPTIRANSLVLYDVTNELVALRTTHTITVGGRGVFGLRLVAPEGYELLEAGPADLVSGSRQDGAVIDLNFRGEQLQAFDVTLRLQRARAAVDEDVALRPVRIDGADEDLGNVVLAAPLALRPTEAKADGLQPTDVRALEGRLVPPRAGDSVAVLGYRYVAPTFDGLVKIERRRTRLTCDTAILASVEPTLLRIDGRLAWTVEFSATDEFQVLVPAAAGEDVRIDGADIKEKTRSTAERADGFSVWTVRLQRRVIGSYGLSVSYDVPLAADDTGKPLTVTVPLLRAEGVARETGHVAVSRGENLEVRVAASEGLERRDVKELPPSLASAFLGFRYFDPAATTLTLELVRHDLETVLGALVRRLHIETVINDQREAVHEIWFEVQNNREQYLELKLPKNMTIWSAFVAGAPVRPALRDSDGAHLIELAKSDTASSAFRVRLILRETLPGGRFGWWGKVSLEPPSILNIPVLRTTWKTYLPRNYRYTDFGGTMRVETGNRRPWLEPVAEELIADAPARAAGGVAKPTLNPPTTTASTQFNATESDDEKAARLATTALDIPIVKEGDQIEFSRLSGLGTIEVSYWGRRVLLVIQGAFALLLLAGLLAASGLGRRPLVPVVAMIVAFAAASLLDGFAGRMAATALATAFLACLIAGAACGFSHLRTVIQRNREAAMRHRATAPAREAARPRAASSVVETPASEFFAKPPASAADSPESAPSPEDTNPNLNDDSNPKTDR